MVKVIHQLYQDTPRIHPWYKFGPNVTNMCGVIVFTSEMLTDRQTDRHANLIRWKTKLGISIRMEISIIVLLFQAVWKFQYGFQQIIDQVFVRV